MKEIVKRLINKCGYRISRYHQPAIYNKAFIKLQKLLTGVNDPVIFDVGAHHGLVSKTFRELFATASIYAFEPFKDSFEILKSNTKTDPGIRIFNFGLSDREGPRSFYSNTNSGTNSLFAIDEASSEIWGQGLLQSKAVIEAQFRTIDSVVQEMGISVIDILKLDVQGAEALVMAGASSTCRKKAVRLLYSEIITQPAYAGQNRFDKALAPFYDSGFDLYNIYNMDTTVEGRLRQVDAIFTRAVLIEKAVEVHRSDEYSRLDGTNEAER